MRCGERALEPCIECSGRDRPALARKLPPAPKQNQRWYRLDAEAGGEGGVGFGVDFADAHSGLMPRSGGLQDRSHHPAWTTPFGPEIDEQRELGAGVALEARGIERNRRMREEGLMTASAPAAFGEALGGNAVLRVTVRTRDRYERVRHGSARENDLLAAPT